MRIRAGLLSLAAVIAGCASPRPAARVLRQRSGRLTHPLLDVELPVSASEVRPFEREIRSLADAAIREKRARFVSVYYRDMNNGPLVEVREDEPFSPASLLKVPMMLAILRRAERDPSLLQQRLVYRRGAVPSVQARTTDAPLSDGGSYSVDELLEAMVARSDNDAAVSLAQLIDTRELEAVFSDLGFSPAAGSSPEDEVTVQEYARFFRVLYNASYLGPDMSEKALAYLTRSTFERGLRAGVPKDVLVAHKFGERRAPGEGEQLHDCGIVYHPKRPYLICVMTRGDDQQVLARVIARISAAVYRRVDGKTLR